MISLRQQISNQVHVFQKYIKCAEFYRKIFTLWILITPQMGASPLTDIPTD